MHVTYFGTQKCVYNQEKKFCKTSIDVPFMKAGTILGWGDASAGIGLNKKLLQFVIKRRLNLVVYVASAEKDYWITWEKIVRFIERNNTEYMVSWDNWLNVISWKEFTRFMPKSET